MYWWRESRESEVNELDRRSPEWVEIPTPKGPVRVRAEWLDGSPLESLSLDRSELEQIESGRMWVSLGLLNDLLWMTVPEIRPVLASVAKEDIDWAEDNGGFLGPLPSFDVLCPLSRDIMLPALNDLPTGLNLVRRCLGALKHVLVEDPSSYCNEISVEVLDLLDREGWMITVIALEPDWPEVMAAARVRTYGPDS